MSMPDMLDAAALRRLDGPALTAMAWTLGLMPPGHVLDTDVLRHVPHAARVQGAIGSRDRERWAPHEYVDQADAVCRAVRTRGYITDVYAGQDFGRVWIKPSVVQCPGSTPQDGVLTLWGLGEPGTPADPTEALALLRACVLALARCRPEKETPYAH